MTLSLVADNPYRVFGVGTQANNATLSANYKSMMSEVLKGRDISLGQDMSNFIKPPLRTPMRLDRARNQLMSARGRCFYALFWFVDSNRLDHAALYYLTQGQREKAVKILQSQRSFSSFINLAVLALLEDRFDDAATLYTRCLQDEEYTQDFVQCVIGDNFKIKGAFVLSKILEVLENAKERHERDEHSDERSYAGGGHGVLNKEAQEKKERVRLVPDVQQVSIVENLHLKKQANSFDRHLNDALNLLIERITEINQEHGMEGDFLEVEFNPNPAAQMVLDEISRFLDINHSLMEAFRQRCFQARERSMYLDYIYNLVSITHYVFHLYAVEFGRQYSTALVQQMRSIIAKLERLYFRLKAQEIDNLIASLRRVEDSLPFYFAVSNSFDKYYLMSDDEHLLANFYEFNKDSVKVIDNFNRTFGLRNVYVDCVMHLQDMVVRYNVSFMLVLVNMALRHKHSHKLRYHLSEQELRVDESKIRPYGVPDVAPAPSSASAATPAISGSAGAAPLGYAKGAGAANGNGNGNGNANGNAVVNRAASGAQGQGAVASAGSRGNYQGYGPDYGQRNQGGRGAAPDTKMDRALRREQKRQQRLQEAAAARRSAFFKRQLSHEKGRFKQLLERLNNYAISPNTATLIEVTRHQIDRLPPPVGLKSVIMVCLLVGAAIGAIYLNSWFNLHF